MPRTCHIRHDLCQVLRLILPGPAGLAQRHLQAPDDDAPVQIKLRTILALDRSVHWPLSLPVPIAAPVAARRAVCESCHPRRSRTDLGDGRWAMGGIAPGQSQRDPGIERRLQVPAQWRRCCLR